MADDRRWGGSKWTGGRRRRGPASLAGTREAAALAATLGRELRAARAASKLTQGEVGARIGVSHARYGDLERGRGAGSPLGLWIAAGIAVGRPMAVSLSRPTAVPKTQEAGHLGAQEAVLRWAAANGKPGTFELQTRPAPNATYIDVCTRDDPRRLLEVVEIWNVIGDLGAALRLFKRKLVEAGEVAASIADGPYAVRGCWVLRDTAANRELVRNYPTSVRSTFPGSSKGWASALRHGTEPPPEPGIVWIDLAGTTLTEVRLKSR